MFKILVILMCTMVAPYYLQARGLNGKIWPKPKHQTTKNLYTIIRPSVFTFEAINHKCFILEQAMQRYGNLMRTFVQENQRKMNMPKSRRKTQRCLGSLKINLTAPCTTIPELDMNESYMLVHENYAAILQSETIWGVLRGLESFSQLLVFNKFNHSLRFYETKIYDEPRFSHRGLLVDTSRHYISIKTIYRILDGMAYNKLNVLHWHIVDDQSFPYESVAFPELCTKGAYDKTMIYTQANVKSIIEYARVRGIRVIPEFDMPAHTRSWGLSHPSLLTRCEKLQYSLGPMDPTKEETYNLLQVLFKEIVELFPEKYIHVGGDEVNYRCWRNNKEIAEFMENNGIQLYEHLEQLFVNRIVSQLTRLNASTVIWNDSLLKGIAIPKSTVVQLWSNNRKRLLSNITLSGFKVLLSQGWYLDHLDRDWRDFYAVDPHDFIGTQEQKNLVIGGEACMWNENVNDEIIVRVIFPRVLSVAERLWSYSNQSNICWKSVIRRFEEQSYRMEIRGI